MLKKTSEKLKYLLGISLILSTLFFWKTSIAQSDTTNISNAVSVDTVIVQVEQIQSDLDEIKEMCEKQRKLLEKKLKKKNKPDDK